MPKIDLDEQRDGVKICPPGVNWEIDQLSLDEQALREVRDIIDGVVPAPRRDGAWTLMLLQRWRLKWFGE